MNKNANKKIKSKLIMAFISLLIISSIVLFTFSAIAQSEPAKRDENGYALFQSFSGIEEIKTNISGASTFNILEILPEGNTEYNGSIGYYIDGQEPINLDVLKTLEGFDARNAQMQAFIAALPNGIASPNLNEAPITTVEYKEIYPWQFDTVGEYDTYTELLTASGGERYETYVTKDEDNLYFELDPYGDFILTGEINLDIDNGDTYQIIDSLQYIQSSQTENAYYYNPTFDSAFNIAGMTEGEEEALLTEKLSAYAQTNEGVAVYQVLNPDIPSYEFVGILGEEFSFDLSAPLESKNYFLVTDYGIPYQTFNPSTAPYFAVHGGYTEDETVKNISGKYFLRSEEAYRYVGENNGEYTSYIDDTAVYEALNVEYSEIYISTFINNNWFEKYVLDASSQQVDMDITVTVKTPSQVTQNDIDTASLIMVTQGIGGINPGTSQGSLPAGVSLVDYLNEQKPLVVSNKVTAITGIREHVQGMSANEISLSVFLYTAQFNQSGILTSGFKTEFSNPDSKVMTYISAQNVLRELTAVDTLPVTNTFANHLRHVINFRYQEEIAQKKVLEVLEIQPIVSQTVSQLGSSAENRVYGGKELLIEDVQSWLHGVDFTDVEINITTMAITEFVGVIDEVIEKYDIVYIGSSIYEFNQQTIDGQVITNYNDINMDGLIYTNIGDIIAVYNDIVGLLDVDYYLPAGTKEILVPIDIDGNGNITREEYDAHYIKHNSTDVTNSEIGTLGRLSGYDFTYMKLEELQTFADAGMPIIISDGLITNDRKQVTQTEIKIEKTVNTLKLTGLPSNEDIYPSRISYQWYKNDVAMTNETASSYTINGDDVGTFYCEVTFTNIETGESVRDISNVATVSPEIVYDIESVGNATKNEAYLPITFEYNMDTVANPDVGTAVATLDPSLVPEGAKVDWEWRRKVYSGIPNLWENPLVEPNGIVLDGSKGRNYTITDNGSNTSEIEITYDVASWINRIICSATVTELDGTVTIYASNRTAWINSGGPEDASASTFYTGPLNTPDTQDDLYTSAFNSSVTVNQGMGLSQISASVSLASHTNAQSPLDMQASSVSTWQKLDDSGVYVDIPTEKVGDNFVADLSATGTYRLKFALNVNGSDGYSYYLYSNDVNVVEGGRKIELDNEFGYVTPPQIDIARDVLDDDRVDNSSKMWEFIMGDPLDPQDIGVLSKANVMSESEAVSVTSSVATYANLSKPEIVYADTLLNYRPIDYTDSTALAETLLVDDTLTYKFRIINETDLTPFETRYEVSLYLDADGDGRYSDHEIISNVSTVDAGTDEHVDNDDLVANNTYIVSRVVPSNIEGPITWQLKIEKVGSDGIIATDKGITYKKPSKMIDINVLQIAGDSPSTSSMNRYPYTNLFNNMRTAGVYNITVTTVAINDLNVFATQGEVEEYLNDYNMLFIGFQESYGKLDPLNGFDPDSALAINAYIDSGKAVLFSHDNISTEVIPIPNDATPVGYPTMSTAHPEQQNVWFSGYFLNTLMRSATGLDRYGVTDTSFGLSQYNYVSKYAPDSSRITASGYESDSILNYELREEIEDVKNAGYDVAYEPGSQKEEFVEQTQGYSTYMLSRSRAKTADDEGLLLPTDALYGDEGEMSYTSRVSQVNKGQITSYPYNINTTEFGGSIGAELSISSTHHQWTQLNVNSDDVTVWYCLSPTGGSYETYDNNYNDVINNYYIYTKGNVTYTGAGHNGTISTALNEAKLFVNTIIGAYRAAQIAPTIDFKDDINDEAMTDKILISVGDELEYDLLTEEEKQIPFVFLDENTTTNKNILIESWFDSDGDGVTDTEITGAIFKSNGTFTDQNLKEDMSGKLMSNTPYYILMPENLLNAVNANGDVLIEIKISVTIGDNTEVDTAKMTINKYGLLDLS